MSNKKPQAKQQTEKAMLTFTPAEKKLLEARLARIEKDLGTPIKYATMLRSMVLTQLRAEK